LYPVTLFISSTVILLIFSAFVSSKDILSAQKSSNSFSNAVHFLFAPSHFSSEPTNVFSPIVVDVVNNNFPFSTPNTCHVIPS